MKSITVVTSVIGLVTALVPSSYGQRFATLHTIIGDNPAGLTEASGVLYGTTLPYGLTGSNCGTVYELQPPATKGGEWVGTVLYSFPLGTPGGACSPAGAPVVAANGSLYGVTSAGGAYLFGVLYDVQPPTSPGAPWTESVLYSFGAPGTNIGYALSGLANGPSGSFYILTSGGVNSAGALCQLQPPAQPGAAWTATVLHSFAPDTGAGPLNSLTQGPDGVLYGTGSGGQQWGQVFQLTPPGTPGGAWTERPLHTFVKAHEGVGNPTSLTVASDGTIYGTAYGYHPPLGAGTSGAFRLTPPAAPGGQWTYTRLTAALYYFEHLNTPLVSANGNLYGALTTGSGGSVFELQPPSMQGGAWTMTTIHAFTHGQVPSGNLVVDGVGTVFGTTAAAPGQPSSGTVYAITTK